MARRRVIRLFGRGVIAPREKIHAMRHVIAAALYDGLLAFEYSLAREILGRDRSQLVADWYRFAPCRVEPGRLFTSHGFEVRPEGTLADLAEADTILIAGWRDAGEPPPAALCDALRTAHARGARLVTICTGAFVLAYAGLLDGRRATTHWLRACDMRDRFPAVRVEADALYVLDQDGPGLVATSAGCAAGLDLCLALVREDFGLDVANTIARRMVAPVHREGGQSQYAESPTGVTADDHFGPVLEWMIAHLEEPIVMHDVARRFGFSLRTFQRRFKDITGTSPHLWLIQQRVARARALLEATDQGVDQVAWRSGLGTAANLRKHLLRHLGTTPRAYRSAFRAAG